VKPRLVDLCSAAGGATKGYQRAGFHVTGVDIEPQPDYCGDEFVQADAMTFSLDGFDAIHASPPCHDWSTVTGRDRKAQGPKGTAWMLAALIERLERAGVPWVVENVDTATMPSHVYTFRLCGSSFGLDVRRHRKFASNIAILAPPCAHGLQTPRFRSLDSSRPAGSLASVVGVHGNINYAGEFPIRCAAMGIDWMPNDRLTQAIPPAYTEFIGERLLAAAGVPR
jgi:DNA (cytosine-5)-methyltransferase 1